MIWLAVAAAIVFLVAAVIRERRARRSALWRHGALLAVALALSILIVQPQIERSVNLRTALVLTAGASSQQVRESGWSVEPEVLSVALPGVEPWSSSTVTAPDLSTFLRNHPQVDHLQVAGAGLEPWDLEDLSPSVGFVEPGPVDRGFHAVAWRRQLREGDPLVVTGSILGLADEEIRLTLEGPGGADVTVELPTPRSGGPRPFTLRTRPPGKGRFLYRLTMGASEGNEVTAEEIDVQVGGADPPAVLWLEDAPSFETRHVKRWLAAGGSALAIRSRVSRDRYRFEYHNLERLSLATMNAELLRRFDLVIAEQRAWERLPTVETTVITEAVAEQGLGVVVRLNPDREARETEPWPLGFAGSRIPDVERLLVSAKGLEAGSGATPLEIPPFELRLQPTMNPLLSDAAGRLLAAARPKGKGNVAVTLLSNTYPWVLEGFAAAQQSYWRSLIEALARPAILPVWHLRPGPILVDEPLEIALEWSAEDEGLPDARFGPVGGNTAAVALRQDPAMPAIWKARIWPDAVGWHRLDGQSATMDFYVAAGDSWRAWQSQRRQRATRMAALRPARTGAGGQVRIPTPVARVPFYLIALLSLGLLWLDERRRS